MGDTGGIHHFVTNQLIVYNCTSILLLPTVFLEESTLQYFAVYSRLHKTLARVELTGSQAVMQ